MLTDWRLTYGSTDFAFGTIASKYVFPQDGPPEISNVDLTKDDADRPRADGIMFGQDFRGGTTVSFDIDVNGADEQEAQTLLATLANVWRADEVRNTPGAVASLTSHTGRTVFGRPRRFQPKYDLTPFGLTAVTCDFQTIDDLWYGPEQSTVIPLVAALGGGLVAPLAAPLATTANSDRSQQGLRITSPLPVWPVFQITGPITNPEIEVYGSFRLAYNLTLAEGQTLVIDTRPGRRSSTVNGVSVAGALRPLYSRLSDTALRSGAYNLAFRGISATGTPQVTVTWRNTFSTM